MVQFKYSWNMTTSFFSAKQMQYDIHCFCHSFDRIISIRYSIINAVLLIVGILPILVYIDYV